MELTLTNQTKNAANATAGIPNVSNFSELDAFKTIFQSLVALFGFIGNLAVCVVITRNKKMKSSTELLIRNLAIADIGILTVTFPLSVIKEKLPYHWPLGKFFCLYLAPTSEIFYGVSVWSIVAIAIERYRHLVCTFKKDRNRAIKLVKRLIIFLWVSNFLLFSAPTFSYMLYAEIGSEKHCYFNPPSKEVFEIMNIILFLSWYCFPVLCILWSYVLISRKLDQSSLFLRNMHGSESNLTYSNRNRLSLMQERRLSQNRRVKRVLTPVVVAFVVLMMPVNIGRMVIFYKISIVHMKIYPVLIYLLSLCIIINSSINPLIYSFVSPGFRAGIRAFLKNRSFRTTLISAGTNLGGWNKRLSFWIKPRRMYTFNAQGDQLNLRSFRNQSAQTPVS